MNNTLCYEKLKAVIILLTTTDKNEFIRAYKFATNSLHKNSGRMTWSFCK